MVDDVKDITEKAESKEALDRARLARERREAEQRKRLDELRAHAAAAQAQREKRDEERRKRQAEQRARDDDRRTQKRDEELSQRHLGQHAKEDDRRLQVEERKRAIWEASISRREALLQRERDRTERLERARAARSSPRPAFAFGSSTPRLLEPVDSAGFFWAARSTNPIDQMNFFESLAASTTNVMFASAPLTRRASALQLDTSDTDNKDEPDRSPQPVWSSVARRRTDLVPTVPAPRAPGRAYSMTRLDRLGGSRPLREASPSMHHLNRTQTRSGETTPGSRPGSAMSNATGVVRRASSAPRKPRPASIAGTGVNTPRGPDTGANSVATTPSVSRDATTVASRPATTPRRPRPLSLHASSKPATPIAPGEGKPPLHRKPKPSKDHDKSRGKSLSASPGRALSPSPASKDSKDSSVGKEIPKSVPLPVLDKNQVNAVEVTQKLEALRIEDPQQTSEIKETIEVKPETNNEQKIEDKPIDVQKPVEKEITDTQKVEKVVEDKREEKKESSVEKTEDNEMTASMVRRITTEEEAKAALAERRRRAREELERQAELERQRLQREAEEEAERQRQEEERQRREEEEARELAALQRKMEEEKLRKAIEAQQQLEKEDAERRVKEEEERKLKAKEEEERRKAADEAEKLKREEAEKEERERLARKQRVEAIMARTRLKKQAEEDKKQQELKAQQQNQTATPENNTAVNTTATKDSVDSATPTPNENGTTNLQNSESEEVGIKAESVESAQDNAVLVDFAQDSIKSDNVSIVSDDSAKSDVVAGSLESASSLSDSASIVTVRESVNVNLPVSVDIGVDNSNGNMQSTDLLQLAPSQPEEPVAPVTNNGNVTADLLGLCQQHETKDIPEEQPTKQIDNTPTLDASNGNANVGHISASFIQTERRAELANKLDNKLDDFTSHNGHNHPLTLQNAI